jgi:cytochrome c oxidase subunit IV
MSEQVAIAGEGMQEQEEHPSTLTYVTVAVFLAVLTAMELTVFYVHALRPVLVPVLLILAVAKFSLVAMFYMHLKYDSRILSGIFVFPLVTAAILVVSLLMLFTYLSHHLAPTLF